MKNELKILTKLELCNIGKLNEVLHGDEKKKKQMGMEVLAYAVMGIFLICISAKVSSTLCGAGTAGSVPGLLFGIASVLILILTLWRAGETLFSYTSYERLITLPFKHFNIILSRFIHVYVEALATSLVVILPGMIAYAVSTAMSPVGWIFIALCILFVPVVPVTIAALIDFAAFSITAKMRHRGVVSIIVSVIAMLALMVVMFIVMGNPENLMKVALQASDAMGMFYPPAAWYAASLRGDILLFLLYVVISLVIGLLLVLLFAKTFQKISAAIQERCAVPKFVMTEQLQTPVKKALVSMELKRFLGTRAYVLNSVIGYIILVVAVIAALVFAILFKTAGLFDGGEFAKLIGSVAFIFPLIIVFLSCLVPTTSSAISIEGKNWWILKSLPVPMKTIAKAKGKLNLLISVPVVLFASVVCCIIYPLVGIYDVPLMVMTIIFPLVVLWFCTYFCLYLNMKNPSLDWDNASDAVKSGPVVLIATLSCIGIAVLAGILSWFLGTFIGSTSFGLLVMSVLLVILTIIIVQKIGKFNIKYIE